MRTARRIPFRGSVMHYAREAAEGITFEDFTMISVSITHRIKRAAKNYPSNKGQDRVRGSFKKALEPIEFCQVPRDELSLYRL